MTTSSRQAVLVAAIEVGDTILNPFHTDEACTVQKIEPGMYGLVELTCADQYGDRHLLSLDPDEEVTKVGDER